MTVEGALIAAGFRRSEGEPGCTYWEMNSGAFLLQVTRRVTSGGSDQARLRIAFRPTKGFPPMPFRPWSIDIGQSPARVVAEALAFLRAVEPWPGTGD